MANINPGKRHPPVTHFLTDPGSVTVPTGEVWRVTIIDPWEASFSESGTSYTSGIGGTNTELSNEVALNAVLDEGTKITDGGNNVLISGWDISTVESGEYTQKPLTKFIQLGNSVTVPSGEIWAFECGDWSNLRVVRPDGSSDGVGGNTGIAKAVLDEGYGISSGNNNDIFLSGYRLIK